LARPDRPVLALCGDVGFLYDAQEVATAVRYGIHVVRRCCLAAAPPRTSGFDDYTKGSYHVRPDELASNLPAEAALHKLELGSRVVVGPSGPLWSYDVIVFQKMKD
jgi:hypothetical protein